MKYFSPAGIHVFAHRGLVSENTSENTLSAFSHALESGATHIETDIQATKDGHAVVFHDNTLQRVAAIDLDVSQCTLAQLQTIAFAGSPIATLEQALLEFPKALFNLDIKRANAVKPTVEAILKTGAHERVLVSSFSDMRRSRAVRALKQKGVDVATGMGLSKILLAAMAVKLGSKSLFRVAARGVHAVQVPHKHPLINTQKPKFVAYVKDAGLRLHYWVVNDAEEMVKLVALGADGIVSDRADIAVAALRQ